MLLINSCLLRFYSFFIFNLLLTTIVSPVLSNNIDEHAELIDSKTFITIENNRITKRYYKEIRINSRAGEQYTKVSIPYSKMVRVSNIEAHIIGSDGRLIKKLKKAQITERSAVSYHSLYEDEYVKQFSIRHNTYPYTLVYSYTTVQSQFINVHHWVPVLDYKVKTKYAELTLSAPSGFGIRYLSNYIDSAEIDSLNQVVVYKWKASYQDLVEPQVFSPPIEQFLPHLIISSDSFNYGIQGSLSSWQAFGDWIYRLGEGTNDLTPEEKAMAVKLTENIADTLEKIRALYHYMQDNTRYINISIAHGGMKPFAASHVCRNKYGDCKALTVYFQAMLAHLGIKSHYTIVRSGSQIYPIPLNFPTQAFDHVILHIPLHNEVLWVDCTSKLAFGYLGSFTQNRDVLVITNQGSFFSRTPELLPQDVLVSRKIKIPWHREETQASFKVTARGDEYALMSELNRVFNDSEKRLLLRNKFVEKSFQLIDYEILNTSRDSAKIDLTYTATGRNIYTTYGDEVLAKNIAFNLPDFELPRQRNLPVSIGYPVFRSDTLIYQKPTGFKALNTESAMLLETKFGSYSLELIDADNEAIIAKHLLIAAGEYPLEEYPDFYSFLLRIQQNERKPAIVFHK